MYDHYSYNYFNYRLFAIIDHYGTSIESGHYTSIIRNPLDDNWYYYNDHNINKVNFSNLKLASDGSNSSYVIMYEKV